MGRAAFVVALVVASACTGGGGNNPAIDAAIDAPIAPSCSPASCAGCCAGGVCQPGNTTSACGAQGSACSACTGNQSCASGTCTAPAPMLGVDWRLITAAAPFGKVASSPIAELAGELWLMAGGTIWHSPDGVTWTAEPGTLPFSPTCAVAFNGALWAFSATTLWSSPDGVTWTQVPVNGAGFGTRNVTSTCFVWKNELWIGGGPSPSLDASPDGKTWTQIGTLDDNYAVPVVYHDTLWQFGKSVAGSYVKTSPDGATWTAINLSAPFAETQYGRGAVTDDKIWLVVPASGDDAVWSTTTGLDFVDVQAKPPFGWLEYFGISTFDPTGTNPRLWIIGGDRVNTVAEIWTSP